MHASLLSRQVSLWSQQNTEVTGSCHRTALGCFVWGEICQNEDSCRVIWILWISTFQRGNHPI